MLQRILSLEEERAIEIEVCIAVKANPQVISRLFRIVRPVLAHCKNVRNTSSGIYMLFSSIPDFQSKNKKIYQVLKENGYFIDLTDSIQNIESTSDCECIIQGFTINPQNLSMSIESHRVFSVVIYKNIFQKIKSEIAKIQEIARENCRYYLVPTPRYVPKTLDQYEKSFQIWPCIHRINIEPNIYEIVSMSIIEKLCSIETKQDNRNKESLLVESPFHKLDVGCSKYCIIGNGNTILAELYDTDDILGHSVMMCVEKVSQMGLGYLCTGYIAYVLNEPCVSCSMALVHGRIKAVVMKNEDKNNGIYTKYKFNHKKSLNHRYPVYKINKQ